MQCAMEAALHASLHDVLDIMAVAPIVRPILFQVLFFRVKPIQGSIMEFKMDFWASFSTVATAVIIINN